MKHIWIVLRQQIFKKRSLATVSLIGASILLVACGKVGGLDRPDGEQSYPQQYPYPPAVTPNASTGSVQTTSDENPLPESLKIRRNSKTTTKTYGQ